MKQKTIGMLISYLNLLFGMCINIFFTPILIKYLGDVDYSIYKIMQSFAGPLIIFNLGIAVIVARSIVRYKTDISYSDEDKKNTLAVAMIISSCMAIIVIIVGLILALLIPHIYATNYTDFEIVMAQKVFYIFVLSTVFHILVDAFNGCLIGHEKYAVNSGISLLKNVIKVIMLLIVIHLNKGIIAIVTIDLIIAITAFLLSFMYTFIRLKEYPKLSKIRKEEFIGMCSFSVAILLQTIVNQVNNNVDTMILGAMIAEKHVITMYTSALALYNIYNSLMSVISGFFLPNATKLIYNSASGDELTEFVIKPGRLNAIIAVAVIFAFALYGKEFIYLWIGEKYIEAYYIALILMIPVTIPLVQNVAISILDASLKRIYRSIVLFVMAIINIIISIIFIHYIGFWGAALGTAVSIVVGHGLLMNIYYAKEFNMHIVKMFRGIFKGIVLAGLITVVLCVPIRMIGDNTIPLFLMKCSIFVCIYIVALWCVGLNDNEKKLIRGFIDKRLIK